MARYTPEFLAALRHRYEQTHQSKRSIAREFGLAGGTILRIAAKEEWLRPPEPMRDLEPAMRLLGQTIALEREFNQQRGNDTPTFTSEATLSRIPVARFTPRLLAALRQRYERTWQSARSIAGEFGVSDRTLRRIASKEGWVRPRQPGRDLEPAARVLEEATALERQYFGRK